MIMHTLRLNDATYGVFLLMPLENFVRTTYLNATMLVCIEIINKFQFAAANLHIDVL